MSITVMFRCVAKAEKVDDENNTSFTIEFRRAHDAHGIDLTFKRKTTSQHEAARCVVGEEYPITIQDDGELGGVFTNAASPSASAPQGDLPLQEEPMSLEDLGECGIILEIEDQGISVHGPDGYLTPDGRWVPDQIHAVLGASADVAQFARLLATRAVRATREQVEYQETEGEREETFEERVARLTREAIEATPADADYTIEEIAFDVATALDKKEEEASGLSRPPDAFGELEEEIKPLVQSAMDAYHAEKRRVHVRAMVEDVIRVAVSEGLELRGAEAMADGVFDTMYPDATTRALNSDEYANYQEIRREVDLLLAERVARKTSEPPTPAPEGERVDRIRISRNQHWAPKVPVELLDALEVHINEHPDLLKRRPSGLCSLSAPDGTSIDISKRGDEFQIESFTDERNIGYMGSCMANGKVTKTIRGILGRTRKKKAAATQSEVYDVDGEAPGYPRTCALCNEEEDAPRDY